MAVLSWTDWTNGENLGTLRGILNSFNNSVTTQVNSNTTNIANNTTNVSTNTANIATNTTNIATNTSDIALNTVELTNVSTRVGVLEGFHSYDNAFADAVTVTDDTYEDLINLTTPSRDAGTYKLEQSLIYSLNSTNTSAYFRSSIDGGVTWLEIRKEPQDNTDKTSVAYFRSIEHIGGTLNLIIQARKEVTGDILEVYRADLSLERKA